MRLAGETVYRKETKYPATPALMRETRIGWEDEFVRDNKMGG